MPKYFILQTVWLETGQALTGDYRSMYFDWRQALELDCLTGDYPSRWSCLTRDYILKLLTGDYTWNWSFLTGDYPSRLIQRTKARCSIRVNKISNIWHGREGRINRLRWRASFILNIFHKKYIYIYIYKILLFQSFKSNIIFDTPFL